MHRAVARLNRAGVVGAAGAVFLALAAWNLGNFAFFVIAGRMLGPEEYGLLAALLAASVVAMAVASAFQYAIAREEGPWAARRDPATGAVYRAAYREALWAVPLVAAALCLAIVAAGHVVADLPLGETLTAVAVVLPMVAFYLAAGQLQAEQRFVPYSVATAMLGLPRPVFMLVLGAVGLGVYGGLMASAAAVAVAAAAAAVCTWGRLAGAPAPSPERWRSYHRALPPLVAGLSGLALLTNLDVVVAKLALTAQQAGEFGAVSVLGKAILVVPQAISTIVLPRVAARRAAGGDTGPLLAVSIGIVFAVGGVATLAVWALHEPIVRLTYGADYVDGAYLLAPMAAASTLLGALVVLLNHHIGRRADAFVWGLLAVAGLEAVLLVLFHATPGQIVAVDVVACAAGLVAHEAIMGRGPDGMVAGMVRMARRRADAGSGGAGR